MSTSARANKDYVDYTLKVVANILLSCHVFISSLCLYLGEFVLGMYRNLKL